MPRLLVALLGLFVALVARGDEVEAARQLVLSVNERLWNQRDPAVLTDTVAEDLIYQTPYSTATGRAALEADARQYYAWAESSRSTFHASAAGPDGAVFLRWESVSQPRGAVKPYNSRGIDFYRVEAGRIVEWRTAHELDPTARNKAVVTAFIDELWVQRDVAAVARHVTPEAKVWITELEHGGPENLVRDAERFFKGWSKSETRITHLVAESDLVAIRWETVATHDGLYGEIPATGQTLTYQGADLFRLSEGRIAEVWSFWDAYGVFTALGVLKWQLPPAPGAPAPAPPAP
jgi:predicted ester cyclase